jgi:hypothetical protein
MSQGSWGGTWLGSCMCLSYRKCTGRKPMCDTVVPLASSVMSCPCRGRACAPWATSRRPGRTRRARSSRDRRGDPPTARPWRVSRTPPSPPPPPLQRHEQHAREKYRVVPPRAASARPGSGSMCRSRRPALTPARATSLGSTVGGSARSPSSTAHTPNNASKKGGTTPWMASTKDFPAPPVDERQGSGG